MSTNDSATLADVLEALEAGELGYSPASCTSYACALKRMAELLDRRLTDIPAHPPAIQELCSTIAWRGRGFKTLSAWKQHLAKVSGAMTRFSSMPDKALASKSIDGWRRLDNLLVRLRKHGSNLPIDVFAAVPRTRTLSRHARSWGVDDPRDLPLFDFSAQLPAVPAGDWASLKRGIETFNELVLHREKNADLEALLPPEGLNWNLPKRSANLAWDTLPLTFRESVDDCLARLGRYDEDLASSEHSRSAFDCELELIDIAFEDSSARGRRSKRTVGNYISTVRWLIRGVLETGSPDDLTDLKSLVTPEATLRAVQAQISRQKGQGTFNRNAAGVFHHCHRAAFIAERIFGCDEKTITTFKKLIRRVTTESVNSMSPHRQGIVDEVKDSFELQQVWLTADFELCKRAVALLAKENLTRREKHRALYLAEGAVLYTLLLGTSPVRMNNVENIKTRGPHRNLKLKSSPRDVSRMSFKKGEMKNRRPYSVTVPEISERILRWYIDEIRPLTIKWNGTQESEFLFWGRKGRRSRSALNRIWNYCADELGIRGTPHVSRHVVGSLAAAQDARLVGPVSDFLGISEAVARRNYIVGTADAAANILRQTLRDGVPGGGPNASTR